MIKVLNLRLDLRFTSQSSNLKRDPAIQKWKESRAIMSRNMTLENQNLVLILDAKQIQLNGVNGQNGKTAIQ